MFVTDTPKFFGYKKSRALLPYGILALVFSVFAPIVIFPNIISDDDLGLLLPLFLIPMVGIPLGIALLITHFTSKRFRNNLFDLWLKQHYGLTTKGFSIYQRGEHVFYTLETEKPVVCNVVEHTPDYHLNAHGKPVLIERIAVALP